MPNTQSPLVLLTPPQARPDRGRCPEAAGPGSHPGTRCAARREEGAQRKLFLVPRTMDLQESARLIGDLLEMAAREKICSLELTHFNFILVDLPAQIIGVILEALVRSPEPDYPRDVVIDIDSGLGTWLETMVREITLKHAAPGESGAPATDGSVEPKERP
jgi:hypothetical protein